MVDARRELLVSVVRELRLRPADSHGRPAADVVNEDIRSQYGPESEPRHQRVVERDALLEAVHSQDDMSDAIDLHATPSYRSAAAAYSGDRAAP